MNSRTGRRRFRLLDYFTLTSLLAFGLVAAALYALERAEHTFFEAAQTEQSASLARSQEELVSEQKAAARRSLLLEHEAGHVTLTRVLANSLWDRHFAPLVTAAQAMPMDDCRAAASPAAGEACYAALGKRIASLPRFKDADAAVHAATKGSTVFKIKVYDMRGLTVYSSEHAQVGEDKADNRGWQLAADGKPASEIVHRARFGAFEGVVEDRDLIQSYVPVLAEGGGIRGVFEIYSDVTPLLRNLEASAGKIGAIAAANQARAQALSVQARRAVEANSNWHFAILLALLAGLYAALFLLVRNGQRIIDEHARTQADAARREQFWHREKMAALAAMAANASHEIGNPLAIISGLAEDVGRAHAAGEPVEAHAEGILAQAARIAEMTRRITMFAAARGESAEPLDVNEMTRAMCDFLGFDTRYRGTRIEVKLAEALPACVAIPDHLNEALMSLLQTYAEAALRSGRGARVRVWTQAREGAAAIHIGCEGGSPAAGLEEQEVRLESARIRIEGMGGRWAPVETGTEFSLPYASAGGGRPAPPAR